VIVSTVPVPHPQWRPPGTLGPQDPGHAGFLPSSYQELIGFRVLLPHLDPTHYHVLASVQVAEDGSAAVLTVHTHPPLETDLTRHLSVILESPKAAIRVVDTDGTELVYGHYDAPLQLGQTVLINELRHQVVAVDWPHRKTETGAVTTTIDPATGLVSADVEDHQQVTVRALPAPEPVRAHPDQIAP
jgi:hypothetical protein